jgi:protein tyrosine/serine phosphatase
MVHCTQGKDRTGLIISLVLMTLGVSLEAIDFDYQLSEEALLPEKESRLAEIREIGLTQEFGSTAKDLIDKMAQHVRTRYGGLDGYLDGIGFGEEKRTQLRGLLLC